MLQSSVERPGACCRAARMCGMSQPASIASADRTRALACRRAATDECAGRAASRPSTGAEPSVLQRLFAAARRCGGASCCRRAARTRAAGGPVPTSSRRQRQANSDVAIDGGLRHLRWYAQEKVARWMGGQGWVGLGCGSVARARRCIAGRVCKRCGVVEVRSEGRLVLAPALERVDGVREGSREQRWRCRVLLTCSAFQNIVRVFHRNAHGSYGKFWSVITSAHYPNLRSAGVPDSRGQGFY